MAASMGGSVKGEDVFGNSLVTRGLTAPAPDGSGLAVTEEESGEESAGIERESTL